MLMLLLVLCTVLVSSLQALPIATCAEQKDCIRMSFAELPVNRPAPGRTTAGPCKTGDCQWQACLILDYGHGCVKDGSISHTCQKSNDVCEGGDFRALTTKEVSSPGEGFQQCQTGAPGSKLYFLLKDGAGCDTGSTTTASIAFDGYRITTAGASMSCSPTADQTQSCTGNKVGMECVWEVTLPNYCKDYSTSGSGSGSGDNAKCDSNAPCQNGGTCQNSICSCPEGYTGYHCETLQCNNVLMNYPGWKVLDGGKAPSCTLGQAQKILEPYDCEPLVEGCDILKCGIPIPPEDIAKVKTTCPDIAA